MCPARQGPGCACTSTPVATDCPGQVSSTPPPQILTSCPTLSCSTSILTNPSSAVRRASTVSGIMPKMIPHSSAGDSFTCIPGRFSSNGRYLCRLTTRPSTKGSSAGISGSPHALSRRAAPTTTHSNRIISATRAQNVSRLGAPHLRRRLAAPPPTPRRFPRGWKAAPAPGELPDSRRIQRSPRAHS